jgi:predicted  nucleic acid-binding Zn-ribbon protein
MSDQQKIHLKFNSTQSLSIFNATKFNDLSKKHMECLKEKMFDLTNEANSVRARLKQLETEIVDLNQELLKTEKAAKDLYSNALKEVLNEMDTPKTPWEAKVIYEAGIPVGIDLILTPSTLSVDNTPT